MQEITREFVRSLAAASGITIPEEQLEAVRQQYQSFMRTVTEIEAVSLAPELDPAITFSLAPATALPADEKGSR